MSAPKSEVYLRISCTNLVNKDTFSKSDPIALLYEFNPATHNYSFRSATELINDNLNPQFITPFKLFFMFESIQKFKILIQDVDKQIGENVLNWKTEPLGAFEFALGDVFGKRGHRLTSPLKDPSGAKKGINFGEICIVGEEIKDNNSFLICDPSAKKLDSKDGLFGKSDPYLQFTRIDTASKSQVPVHKTEVIMKNLNPTWKPVKIPIGSLCRANFSQPFLIECFDWNKNGKMDYIGAARVTLGQLIEQPILAVPLINEDIQKKKKKKYTNSGMLELRNSQIVKEPTFLEYLAGGCEISLMVAVDFTLSNGDPRNPASLHYMTPTGNEYQKAIQSVGNVLSYYDSDQMFPCWGYGAKLPNGQVSHCFQLSPQGIDVHGVDGILNAYATAISAVQLYGPTNFAPSVRMACDYARQHCSQQSQHYAILLIITDGEITDIDDTIEAIQQAAKLPLSIVIVGVGGADFANMDVLDDDDHTLFHGRDIVQFVPFRELQSNPPKLAEEVLKEIPGQLEEYMRTAKIMPNPPSAPQP